MVRTLIVLAVLVCGACRRGPHEPRFAVELPPMGGSAATRVVVNEGLGSDSQFPLASLTAASPGHESLSGWETLELNYAAEGDKVKVTVYAMHREYDARRHATIFRSQRLGAHIAGLRESVRLAELEKFGYSPLTLRVVPAR
jgi:hypothetical protein